MKKITTLLYLLLFSGSSLIVQAQDLILSATYQTFTFNNLSNNQSAPPSFLPPLDISSSLGTYSFTIGNSSGTSNNLILTQASGRYIAISGTGIDDFDIDESNITSSIAPGNNVTVYVRLKTSALAGSKTITLTINSNDPTDPVFNATLRYTVLAPTMVITTSSGTLANNGSTNYPGEVNQRGFGFDLNIANTGTTVPLILSQNECPINCAFISLSGEGINDFTFNESNVPLTINSGNNYNVIVLANPNAPFGTRSVTITIHNNDPNQNTYSHTFNYTFTSNNSLSIQSAKNAGIVVFPSPSTNGELHITAPSFTVSKIELINPIGITETVSSLDFQTSLKGIVTVLIHTDKGIFREKVLLQ